MAIGTTGVNVTSFTDTGRSASSTNYYEVTAYDSAGESGPSNCVAVNTPAAVAIPNAPSNLAWTRISATQIQLS